MSRGIVIIALGSPYYGNMAFNLAVTIKAVEDTPITLIHDDRAVSQLGRYNYRDYMDSVLYKGSEHPMKVKTCIYDLSPYDETLLLDADMLWLKQTPVELFAELKNIDLTIANHGYTDLETLKKLPQMNSQNSMYWVEPGELKVAYQFARGLYYSLSTEVVWFKRSEANRNYFEWVKDVWDGPLVKPRSFAGSIPDEFAFSVAGILSNLYPHAPFWRPSFWAYVDPRKGYSDADVFGNYYLYSAGGKIATDRMKTFYNRRINAVFARMQLQYPFQLTNKIKYIPERENG